MSVTKITLMATAVAASGLYLRRGVKPVIVAYRVGQQVERLAADPSRYVPAFTTGYRIGRRERAEASQ